MVPMMRTSMILCGVLACAALASADNDEILGDNLDRTLLNLAFGGAVDDGKPRLELVADGTSRVDQPFVEPQGAYGPQPNGSREAVAWSADKTAAWAVGDIQITDPCIADGHTRCDKLAERGWDHAVVVVDHMKASHIVAYSVEAAATDAAQAKALKAGVLPQPLARKIDPGAEDAVKLFESTLADPAAFAATVSPRADSVLFGSGKAERYSGGAAIKAQLAKWNLKLTVRDGVQAGVAGKSVVWIGANVDATSVKHPKTPAMPYRLFAVYEHTAAGWQLVGASFGVIVKIQKFDSL
jgi:hypothetical protein